MNHQTTNFQETRSLEHRFGTPRKDLGLLRGLIHTWRRFRRWQIENQAIRHLESLQDHLLVDIGIDRAEITTAVRGHFEQQEPHRHFGAAYRAADAGHRLTA